MAAVQVSDTALNKQTQKIMGDFQTLVAAKLPFLRDLQLGVVDGFNRLTGVMIGPEGSPYANGHFHFVVEFLAEYPFKPPKFTFVTKICHPNVNSQTGIASHDQLIATWSPRIKMVELFNAMYSLLSTPRTDLPVENDPLGDKTVANARRWTDEHARAAS